MIQNELRPLKEDLADMGDILQDFAERKSITVMGRVRYAILDKNKLEDLKGKFSRFTKTFESMLSLLNMEANDVHIQNNVVSQRKLDAIIHEKSKEAIRRHIEAQETKELRRKLEQVLEILKERPFPKANPVNVRDQNRVLDQLETQLKNLGVSSEKANAIRHKASEELLEQPRPSSIGILPFIPRFTPQNNNPLQTVVADECRILVVDGSHGDE